MSEPRPYMTSEDATTLYELRRIWEGKYKIDCDSDGVWRANRLIGGVSLITADTGSELRALIGDDYSGPIRDTQLSKR